MLKVLQTDERFDAPCVMLLGGFDGLHLGHRQLLEAARATGLPMGITLLSGNKEGGDLFTFAERERICAQAGISFVIEIPFTESVRQTAAADFARTLLARVNAKVLVCGEDFRFGRGAEGTPELLRTLFAGEVHVLPIVCRGGVKVGTAEIRQMLLRGDVAGANELLPGGFFLLGRVEHGRQVGRSLGFPTLNLTYPRGKAPLHDGVYGGRVITPAGEFLSIINFGARPTFGVEERKVEAYLAGFSGDLYGAEVLIFPQEFYRPIQRFSSADALKRQLQADEARLLSKAAETQKEDNV